MRGLKAPPTKHMGACRFHMAGNCQRLFFAFDGTGPGDNRHIAIADGDVTDTYHRILGTGFPADEFIGPRDGDDILYPSQTDKQRRIDSALVPQYADRHPFSTRNGSGLVAPLGHSFFDSLDLIRGSIRFHYD